MKILATPHSYLQVIYLSDRKEVSPPIALSPYVCPSYRWYSFLPSLSNGHFLTISVHNIFYAATHQPPHPPQVPPVPICTF